jgi:hypothetical protein
MSEESIAALLVVFPEAVNLRVDADPNPPERGPLEFGGMQWPSN